MFLDHLLVVRNHVKGETEAHECLVTQAARVGARGRHCFVDILYKYALLVNMKEYNNLDNIFSFQESFSFS